jgi:anti-anti-sigma factor
VVQLSETTHADGRCVVSVAGEFDLAAVEEFLSLARQSLTHCSALELDLDELSFIDSSGLGALLRVRHDAGAYDASLRLVNVSPETLRLLRLTGLRDLFEIHPSEP